MSQAPAFSQHPVCWISYVPRLGSRKNHSLARSIKGWSNNLRIGMPNACASLSNWSMPTLDFAPSYKGDIGAMKAAFVADLFLRPAVSKTQNSQVLREEFTGTLFHGLISRP